MEYILDIRFEDSGYNAIVHFVTTLKVNDENEAKLFVDELIEGFKRKGVFAASGSYIRIDNDEAFKERQYEYFKFCMSRATATIQIEQFLLDNPDQSKSLFNNLTEKLLSGEKSTALIGKKYNIPVRVMDKGTKNPINGDFYYSNIEHLIPKK